MPLSIGGAPIAVAKHLSARVGGLPWRREDVPVLRANFESHAQVDYDDLAETFAHRYLLANYWKAFFVLDDVGLSAPETIVDLGAGSGAATAAVLAWLHRAGRLPARARVVMVDRSPRQLAIARDLIAAASDELGGLSVEVQTLETTIGPGQTAWRRAAAGADLVLASHLLTENVADAAALISLLVDSASTTGRLLVIERPDDEIWEHLPCRGRSLRIPSTDLPLNGFSGRGSLSMRYCSIPTGASTLPDLVDRYFRAWKEQSVDQLDDVFSVDATYQEKPSSEPIRSLDGIRTYWTRRVLPQVEPRPRVLRLSVEEGSAFVEWEAELTVGPEHKLVSGVMELELDSGGERIGCLRESYSSRILG